MRFAVTAAGVFFAVACTAAYLREYSGTTANEPSAAFDCVVSVVGGLGYNITEADPSAGQIEAKTPRPALNRHDASALINELRISVTEDPESDKATIAIAATNKDHANTILSACTDKEPAEQ